MALRKDEGGNASGYGVLLLRRLPPWSLRSQWSFAKHAEAILRELIEDEALKDDVASKYDGRRLMRRIVDVAFVFAHLVGALSMKDRTRALGIFVGMLDSRDNVIRRMGVECIKLGEWGDALSKDGLMGEITKRQQQKNKAGEGAGGEELSQLLQFCLRL